MKDREFVGIPVQIDWGESQIYYVYQSMKRKKSHMWLGTSRDAKEVVPEI